MFLSHAIFKPDPKFAKKAFAILQSYFSYLSPRSKGAKPMKGGGTEEFVGEYQSIMEQEFFDFVLFEVPWIVN
jgi:V-type H+-transporting ATPase subunit C